MNGHILSPGLTIAEVLDQWNAAASVFIRFRMACVGCPLGCFDSLESAARDYGLETETLIQEIQAVIAAEYKE